MRVRAGHVGTRRESLGNRCCLVMFKLEERCQVKLVETRVARGYTLGLMFTKMATPGS